MKLLRRLPAALLLWILTSTAFAEGVTYADGSVSPFRAQFYKTGFLEPYNTSSVTGVAAEGGALKTVTVNTGLDVTSGRQACLFNPSLNQLVPLYDPSSVVNSTVGAVSATGSIKVGYSDVVACFWDRDDNFVPLALPAGRTTSIASAVSSDGSTIAGYTGIPRPGFVDRPEATVWSGDGRGPILLGLPPGADNSFITGVSANGQILCGTSSSLSPPVLPARAFRFVLGGTFESLGVLPGFEQSTATGISSDGKVIVGGCGTPSDGSGANGSSRAFVWTPQYGMAELKPQGVEGVALGSAAYAVSSKGTVIAGTLGVSGGAYRWRFVLFDDGSVGFGSSETIAGVLLRDYRIVTSGFQLDAATAISADGYTYGGFGTGQDGKLQGWVAVLPPILFPPMVTPPGPQSSRAGETFLLPISATRFPTEFGAKGLPRGFRIDRGTGVIAGLWSADEVAAGSYTVVVSATNRDGTGTATFVLTLEPPAGEPLKLQKHGFLPLNKPPGEEFFLTSFSTGLSANGLVGVGQDGIGTESRAYRWSAADGITALPMLPNALLRFNTALAASADGDTIVGQGSAPLAEDGTGGVVAVAWRRATAASSSAATRTTSTGAGPVTRAEPTFSAVSLGVLPTGTTSQARGVSADGSVIVGYGDMNEQGATRDIIQAFRWTAAGGLEGLGWLPGGATMRFSQAYAVSADGNTVVGVSDSSGGTQPFRWTRAEGMVALGQFPGATYGRATAVSADGSVIVGYCTLNATIFSAGTKRAFRWTQAEGLVDLGLLPGADFSEANALSADGSVVIGQSGITFQPARAFIWDRTNGMRELKTVIGADNPQLAGVELRNPTGISANGQKIVGISNNPVDGTSGTPEGFTVSLATTTHPPFFAGEIPLSNGVYFLRFAATGLPFGYYAYLSDPHFIYHFDLGYEYWFDAQNSDNGIFFYDFASQSFFYTSPNFPFPFLYDFSLGAFLYYFPNPDNPERYNTNGVRYFFNYLTGQIIVK